MAPTRTPHHLSARNEARCSCYGVAVITRNTSVAWRGFDYPADDARRWYARGCKRVSWQIPFALANRIFVLAAEVLLLIRAVKVSLAKGHRCSQSASERDRSVTVSENRALRLLHSALSPWQHVDSRPVDGTAAVESEFSCSSSARPNIASPALRLTNMARN